MEEALRLLNELQDTNGMNAKKRVIESGKDNESFRQLLFYALNPFLTYKVSDKTLRGSVKHTADYPVFSDIYDVAQKLSSVKAVNDEMLCGVQTFLLGADHEERKVFIKILSKTLRLGVTAKTVNKVIPDLIPEWEVQQAYPIEKHPIKPGTWFSLSQKLNGIRATCYKGRLYARSGEVFDGLDHIEEALADFAEGYVFDGELTLLNKEGFSDNEAFRMAAGIVNSEASDKTAVCFTVFDVIPVFEFEKSCGTTGFGARQKLMDLFRATVRSDYVHFLEPLYQGTDQSMIGMLLDQMVREDKEGLMLNLDVPYQRKRHSGILKIKRFYTMDLPILRCEEGSSRLSGTLGAFVVDYMGNEVSVGSGFTDAQRDDFWRRRDELPGILCEVKYKEVSCDKKTGAKSLQFPVFVGLRTDKAEPSFG